MSNETTEHVNREYKDRLFTFIFGSEQNREWTLSLYNAVNGSHYTDASLIRFNTLKDMLYMEMRNDTSFLISDVLSVYEHQSTPNPNMPLRLLQYVSHPLQRSLYGLDWYQERLPLGHRHLVVGSLYACLLRRGNRTMARP